MGRNSQHADDTNDFPRKHVAADSSTEGGACLTAHYAARSRTAPGKLIEKSCNYRWQGYKRALDADSAKYNDGAYGALVGKTLTMRTRGGAKKLTVERGAWNVAQSGDNFTTTCNTPYWHESHHLIPNGVLTEVLANITTGPLQEEYRLLYRSGLLDEKYNLNHMENMVILPLDVRVAEAMNLPRHRQDAGTRHHKDYSDKVMGDLQKVFPEVTKQVKEHNELPPYEQLAEKLVNLSKKMRRWVFDAGGSGSLSDAARNGEEQSL